MSKRREQSLSAALGCVASLAELGLRKMDEIEKLQARAANIQQVVDEQANDMELWFLAETAAEGYLQQELRRLHAIIEGDAAIRREKG